MFLISSRCYGSGSDGVAKSERRRSGEQSEFGQHRETAQDRIRHVSSEFVAGIRTVLYDTEVTDQYLIYYKKNNNKKRYIIVNICIYVGIINL